MYRRTAAAVGLACLALPATSGYYWPGHVLMTRGLMQLGGSYSGPDVASSARGANLVSWSVETGDGTQDVYAIWVTSGLLGDATRLNTTTAGDQVAPAVAMDANGAAVVVWESQVAGQVPGVHAIYARRYPGVHAVPGNEFQINAQAVGSRSAPDVAMDAFGNFVAVWQRIHQGSSKIFARRFASDGAPVGGDFEVGNVSSLRQSRPAVAMSSWGEFVVAWEECDGANCEVVLRSFAADGTPDGSAMSVDAPGPGTRNKPALSMDPHGGFLAVWNSQSPDGSAAIHARRFLPGGGPHSGEFPVNEGAADSQSEPAVAVDATGDYSIVWEGPESGRRTMFLRMFARDGAPLTPELNLLAPFGEAAASLPGIAVDADGDAAISYLHAGPGFVSASMMNLIGPEDIPTEVTIADSVDPAVPGEPIVYTVALRNLHEVRTDTGIPAVDSAIGSVGEYVISGSGDGASLVVPEVCQESDGSYWCAGTDLAAGDTVSWAITARVDHPATLHHSVWLWASQYYSGADVADIEQTSVACAPGDGPGEIVLRQKPYSAVEGESAWIEVERVNGTCGVVSASYFSSGWADSPYTVGQVSWAGGETGVKRFELKTTEDNIDEEPASIEVRVSPSGDAADLMATYTLLDDDPAPTMTLSPLSLVLTEGEGVRRIMATLSHPTEKNISIPMTSGGTAIRNVDFVANVIAVNPRPTQSEIIVISAGRDHLHEGDETVVLTISEPVNAVMSEAAVLTAVIKDVDPTPVVRLAGADFSLQEGAAKTVLLGITPASAKPITVPLLWSGTAARGSDFVAPTSVTIPAGQTGALISISAQQDGLDEDSEVAGLTLGAPADAALGSDITHNTTIQDIDPTPSIYLVGADQMVRENAGSIPITAELSAVSGREVRVSIYPSGDGTYSDDFTFSPNAILMIPAGSRTGSITLNITNDSIVELDERVTLTMLYPTNAISGSRTTQTVTIRDDDPVPLDPVHDALGR